MKLTKKITAVVVAASMTIIGIIPPREVTVKAGETATATATETTSPEPTDDAKNNYGLTNPVTDENGVTTWDTIYFGSYWQNDINKDGTADTSDDKEPIKWRVLSVDGDDAFLLADKGLDCKPYHGTKEDITWENCTLRTWLNGEFMENAFSEEEMTAVNETDVVNDNNPTYGTTGGNNTKDKVYLLSIAEASNESYGFNAAFKSNSKTREALNTSYAKTQGADTCDDNVDCIGNGYWWLRSPGNYSNFASCVYTEGNGQEKGSYVYNSKYAIRPALRINLSSISVWSYAGTVDSDDNVTEPGEPTETSSPTPTATSTANVTTTPTAIPGTTPTLAPTATSTTTVTTPTTIPGTTPTLAPTPTTTPGTTPTLAPTATSTTTVTTPTTIPGTTTTSEPTATSTTNVTPTTTTPPTEEPITTQPTQGPSLPPEGSAQNSGLLPSDSTQQTVQPSITTKQPKVTITPPGTVKLTSVIATGERKISIEFNKVSGASGYQIAYQDNKKLNKPKYKTTTSLTMVIKKLKAKKTYYIKVRAYKKSGGKKVYGKWSDVKKVKVKK